MHRLADATPFDALDSGRLIYFARVRIDSGEPGRGAPSLLFSRPMRQSRPALYTIALALLATAGCSSTRLESTWSDPHYSGEPFRKLMIIGLGATEGGRAEFENSVADALLAHGVTGVSSTGYFASAQDMTRDAVRRWVQQDGYQGVLVTRLIDVRRQQHAVAPTYADLWGYWGYYGTVMTSPGYVEERTTLLINTDLFEAPAGKVVYTAESKSSNPSSRRVVIRDLTALLVKDLTKRGLLPDKP
jgi:hypothetical protein